MTAPFLECIDWSRPWLAHVRSIGREIAFAADWRVVINIRAEQAGLHNSRGLPIRFVQQADLPAGVAYETFIHDTGCVPTRDNLHDFFNALVWLTFPQIKVQLNALQAMEIEKSKLAGAAHLRGKLRDAATIFDENAVLLITSDQSMVDALRAHQWQDVFLRRRDEFIQGSKVLLFGHALMEKLVVPYKAITGHMWVVTISDRDPTFSSMVAFTEDDLHHFVDATVSDELRSGLTTHSFSPLPVLGIPDWWIEQSEAFYGDEKVFRPRRTSIK